MNQNLDFQQINSSHISCGSAEERIHRFETKYMNLQDFKTCMNWNSSVTLTAVEKVQLLEAAVLLADLETLQHVVEQLRPFELTCRALGLAMLSREPDIPAFLLQKELHFSSSAEFLKAAPRYGIRSRLGYRFGQWHSGFSFEYWAALPIVCSLNSPDLFGSLYHFPKELRNHIMIQPEATRLKNLQMYFQFHDEYHYDDVDPGLLWILASVYGQKKTAAWLEKRLQGEEIRWLTLLFRSHKQPSASFLPHIWKDIPLPKPDLALTWLLNQAGVYKENPPCLILDDTETAQTDRNIMPFNTLVHCMETGFFEKTKPSYILASDWKKFLRGCGMVISEQMEQMAGHDEALLHRLYVEGTHEDSKIQRVLSAMQSSQMDRALRMLNCGYAGNLSSRQKLEDWLKDNGSPEIRAMYMDWKNRNIDPLREADAVSKKELRHLNAAADSAYMLRRRFSTKTETELKVSPSTQVDKGCKACWITSWKGQESVVDVPSRIGRSIITGLAASAFKAKDVRKVRLPEGLKVADHHAFSHLKTLDTLILPSSLQFFGRSFLDRCPDLQKLIFTSFDCSIHSLTSSYSWLHWDGETPRRILDVYVIQNSPAHESLKKCMMQMKNHPLVLIRIHPLSAGQIMTMHNEENRQFDLCLS